MSNEPRLPRDTRAFIVLIAFAQGLLLWFAETGHERHWWPFSELGGCVYWYTLVLGVPGVMSLSVRRIGDRRFWQHAALLAGVLAVLAAWAAWSATGAPGLQSGAVLGAYGTSTALALFVALPWLQCRLQHGRWTAPYAELFEYAWQSALTLLLAALFVGICWAVLTLWAELFALVRIYFFQNLFRERPFVYLATGGMAGLGILIGRTQEKPIRIARQIVLAVFTGLLPLLAFIAVLFAISLVFTGLAPLWSTRSAAKIVMALVGVFIVFVNAVVQDGRHAPPYPAWLRRVVDAGLLALPVLAGIGLYALFARLRQYGWTADRYWAVVISIVLSAYALGYAAAVLRRGAGWLALLQPVNRALSLIVVAIVMASNSLLLDPHRLGVDDQIARWRDGRTDAKHLDLEQLRFASGRRGYAAAQALQSDARVIADAQLAQQLARVLAKRQRYEWLDPQERKRSEIKTRAGLAAIVHPAAGMPAPDDALLDALLATDSESSTCRHTDNECIYLVRDVDGDGIDDALVCQVENGSARCALWDRSTGSWHRAAQFNWWNPKTDLRSALQTNALAPARKRWPGLKIGEQTAEPE